MVFKRRTPRTYLATLTEAFWPRGGWTRAFHYVRHRIRRLPDDPHRIARGVAAGVFVSFTPLFGLHFISSIVVAKLIRGNILAALLGTFFGNPLTTPIIAISSIKLGSFMLGKEFDPMSHEGILDPFVGAAQDLKHNFFAVFTHETTHWQNLIGFWHEIFLPYLIGGIIPGVIISWICCYLSAPLIAAYQKHRRKVLQERFEKLAARLKHKPEHIRDKAAPGNS